MPKSSKRNSWSRIFNFSGLKRPTLEVTGGPEVGCGEGGVVLAGRWNYLGQRQLDKPVEDQLGCEDGAFLVGE